MLQELQIYSIQELFAEGDMDSIYKQRDEDIEQIVKGVTSQLKGNVFEEDSTSIVSILNWNFDVVFRDDYRYGQMQICCFFKVPQNCSIPLYFVQNQIKFVSQGTVHKIYIQNDK